MTRVRPRVFLGGYINDWNAQNRNCRELAAALAQRLRLARRRVQQR